MTGSRLKRLIGSTVLTAGSYLVFSLWAGLHEVAAAFAQVPNWGVAVLLGLSLVNYFLRFGRWQRYLARLGHPQPPISGLCIYFSGFALTTTPGKAGEMLRGVFLNALAVPYTVSTAAFLSERLSDLVAIVLLALPGLGDFPKGEALAGLGAGAAALLLGILAASTWLEPFKDKLIARQGKSRCILAHSLELLLTARCLHRPLPLLLTTALSLLAWSTEAFGFHLLLGWLGFASNLPQSCTVYALAMLAGALSFLPGGLGGTEATMVYLLIWLGMPAARATAATVLIRLTTLWFAVALGMLVLLLAARIKMFPALGS